MATAKTTQLRNLLISQQTEFILEARDTVDITATVPLTAPDYAEPVPAP